MQHHSTRGHISGDIIPSAYTTTIERGLTNRLDSAATVAAEGTGPGPGTKTQKDTETSKVQEVNKAQRPTATQEGRL